ncbi:LysR family transcriptional regulator [Kocuria dechangensis]|jgi:DNA-binding transcriptional LysR family regulator|uniref:LysR family transcriptional regulator n=1 Tax=Kocuria dechangensis TaxID=1176249 RepID=A0A917GIP3_9MICC|nr:LysR family transcriptional regulator [Kocuria dechangensis]GGG47371.1 LysR family transcriptional regulator [Kocuria dechangensis]
MDIRHIRYFLEVVREGSISKAAKSLGMTQPPLSAAMSALEKELGVRLLERTPRGIRPTPAGLHLVERGTRLVRESQDLTRELKGHGRGVVGALHLAVYMPFSWSYLPVYLRRFGVASPGVEVTLHDPSPDETLDGVANGTFDLAVMATSDLGLIRHAYSDVLVTEPVRRLELVALVNEDFPHPEDPLPLERLAEETWLLPEPTPRFPGVAEVLTQQWERLEVVPPRLKPVKNLQTTLPLISAGMGVTILPPEVLGMRTEGVEARRLSPAPAPLDVVLLWSSRQEPTEVAQRFIDTVRDVRAAQEDHAG